MGKFDFCVPEFGNCIIFFKFGAQKLHQKIGPKNVLFNNTKLLPPREGEGEESAPRGMGKNTNRWNRGESGGGGGDERTTNEWNRSDDEDNRDGRKRDGSGMKRKKSPYGRIKGWKKGGG